MRTIIIIISFLLINIKSKAQVQGRIIPVLEYDTCNCVSQYAGEWIYTNGSETIKIYLRAHRIAIGLFPNYHVRDVLLGWHEYTKNGVVIESDYQYRFDVLPSNHDSLSLFYRPIWLEIDGLNDRPDGHMLSGSIHDITYQEYKNVWARLNATQTTMDWEQYKHSYGCGINGTFCGMTLPPKFTLIKQ